MSWMLGENGKALARAKSALRDASKLESATKSPAAEAQKATAALVDEWARRQLDGMPLDELKPLARGEGIRWAALEANGFRSVGDLHRAGWATVDAKPGIGEQTVRSLRGVVTSIFGEMRKTIPISFDPGDRTKWHTSLLSGLWLYEHQLGLQTQLQGHAEVKHRLETLFRSAEQTSHLWGKLFVWGERRAQAEQAQGELAELVRGESFQTFEKDLRAGLQALKTRRPDEKTLWSDFAKRASAYYALLEGVHVQPGKDEGAARGYIPLEIVDAVEKLELRRDGLNLALRAYQVFGAKFAVVQRKTILGDEMGLGKTIQALAFIAHLKATGATHILVVSPACVLANWEHEIERFSTFKTIRLHGPDKDSALQEWTRHGGIGLTTYDTLRSLDFTTAKFPGIVVADEAHYVKNPAAKRSLALAAVAGPADRVLFMTGTPMENRKEEFKALVNYLQPGSGVKLDKVIALPGARAFRESVAPVYLRRNQADVLHELPERIEVEDWVDLGEEDGKLYREAVASGSFMAMRRAAILPGKPEESSKLARLLDIVEEAREEGLKVVVFSYFLDVLEIIHRILPGTVFGPLTGAVSASGRFDLVKDFSACEGPAVLVSQIQAGGVGLNIQAASIVVITEPQWKPSTEEQAIARCHRMGQVRRVQVHRLLTRRSVDERMLQVLRLKAKEFDEVARPSVIKETTSSATAAHQESEMNQAVEALQHKTESEIIRLERERLSVAVPELK
jgi:superfamily II DNA or RNA helicase